jgi:hypothetical protein
LTIIEALKLSRENGRTYSRRPKSGSYVGWIAWDDDHEYYGLSAEDLIAEDWQDSAQTVSEITGGRWVLAEDGNASSDR